MKHFICLLYMICLSSWILAQPVEKLKFRRLPDGISNNLVSTIFQDSKGFMWFGTDNGLNKFDGYNYTIYENDPINSSSIFNCSIAYIYEDKLTNFWLCLVGEGLNYFDRKHEKFKKFKAGDGDAHPSSNAINMISEDADGTFWLSTEHGLNAFNPKTEKFKHYTSKQKETQYKGGVMLGILFVDSNFVWCNTSTGGIARFDKKQKTFFHFATDNSSIKDNEVRTFAKSKEKNKFWIGYNRAGVSLISIKGNQLIFEKHYEHNPNETHTIAGNSIKSMCEDRYGRLWVGVENKGISLLNPKTNRFSNYKYDKNDKFSLSNDSPWSIYEDRVGNIWVGTFNQGVNVVYNQYYDKFEHYYQKGGGENELTSNNISCFWETNDSLIWIGTDGGGISLWNREKNTFTNFNQNSKPPFQLTSNAIWSVCEDKKQRLWFSTWDGGINLYNPKNSAFEHYTQEKNGLVSNTHFYILNGKDNIIYMLAWTSTIVAFDVENNKVLWSINLEKQNENYHHFFHIYEDTKENLWIGSANGLILMDKLNRHSKGKVKFFQPNNQPNSLSNKFVNTIYEDSKGNIWVGTMDGLNKFNPKKQNFDIYYKRNGLPNDNIKAIIEDKLGKLWISTDKGLSRFDYENKLFENFFKLDGLQEDEFVRNAIWRTKKGEILAGGINGFNVFDPQKMKKNPVPPKIYLTGLKIFNKPIDIYSKDSPLKQNIEYTTTITLNHTQSVFTIEYVALNYIRSFKNQYAYKLEGLENNWNYVGSQRSATYTNLDAGTYTFIIKATNNDGVWNEEGIKLIIIVLPPWWETWWFRTLLIASIILLTFLGFRWRIKSIKSQNIYLEKLVKERTFELKEKNEILEVQAEEIKRMNELLNQENEQLQGSVKELTKARVMMQEVDFNEFSKIFPSEDACYQYLAELKWQNGYKCIRCSNTKYAIGSGHYARRCTKCAYNESCTINTIFHHSHLPIQKAFFMLFLVYANKGNITSIELSQILKMRQPSCWKFRNKIIEKLKEKEEKHTHLDGWGQIILE